MAVKVLSQSGSGFTSDVLNGILYAADNGADVASMSLGGSFSKHGNNAFINVIKRVMDYAGKKGMLVVVAAGNDGANLNHNGDTFDAYCDLRPNYNLRHVILCGTPQHERFPVYARVVLALVDVGVPELGDWSSIHR